MIKFLKSLYFDNRFFAVAAGLVALFILGYLFESAYAVARLLFLALAVMLVVDLFLLYRWRTPLAASRIVADRLSNGDENTVTIIIRSIYPFATRLEVIDEIPHQFQKRDFIKFVNINGTGEIEFTYYLRPISRGVYNFGSINIFANSPLRLIKRKFSFAGSRDVAVYPSFMQVKKFDLLAFTGNYETGIKKTRKSGNSFEFDQIRNYVAGDDPRTVNWKASARTGSLMVNHYQDERSQQVYNFIDMGRAMKMPFQGLTLLDYAVNSTLVLSSIALRKYDKPGLITFNHEIGSFLKADHKKSQMLFITDALYKLSTDFREPNYPLLYSYSKSKITQRSLIFLYTNFETITGLQRHLEYLRLISKHHLLVTVFFKNTELDALFASDADKLSNVYTKVIAEKMAFEKRQIVKELNNQGILTIYTEPENLTADVINKYLILKAQRKI